MRGHNIVPYTKFFNWQSAKEKKMGRRKRRCAPNNAGNTTGSKDGREDCSSVVNNLRSSKEASRDETVISVGKTCSSGATRNCRQKQAVQGKVDRLLLDNVIQYFNY